VREGGGKQNREADSPASRFEKSKLKNGI